MTASPALATATPRRAAFALPGPYRAVLRQHRTALWIALGLFALSAAALAADRLWVAHAADVFAAADCSIRHTTRECGGPVRGYLDAEFQFGRNLDYMGMGILALPCLIGAFVAGPLIARDLETGTYKVAWTQSLSPARWLADRLTLCAAAVTTGVVLLVAVQRWAWTTGPELEYDAAPWHERAIYGSVGPVALGYALLGLAVGALVGVLMRHTLRAMSATLAIMISVVAVLPLARHHLWPTETVTWSRSYPPATPGSGHLVERGMLTSDGRRLPESLCWSGARDPEACFADHQVTGWYNDFHPASHFWPLQLMETGILLALTAATVYATFRILRRRTA
ncbi:hypothetical protein AB0I16_03280 [Streptomyces sp. NPDC050703]|uniref:hypothetical protein n=1 Tax=Streptomyces sp. NPDC050703 TaxID=3157218 RepID=UPI0034209D44